MGSLVEELRRREAAARAEADRLRSPDRGACGGAGQGGRAGHAAGDRLGRGSARVLEGACRHGAADRSGQRSPRGPGRPRPSGR